LGKIKKFVIAKPDNNNSILRLISTNFATTQESPEISIRTFFDTFDWRLYQKKLTLCREKDTYLLLDINQELVLAKYSLKNSKMNQHKFWWEFPTGKLQTAIKYIVSVRALLPVSRIVVSNIPVRVLNTDQKTVTKLSFDSIYYLNGKKRDFLSNHIKVFPVKGYPKPFHQLCKQLSQNNLTVEKRADFLMALEAAGQNVRQYSSKINVRLDPDMLTRQAAKKIIRFLIQIIRMNEQGIKADIDTEFLHDFRVAIRRIRSVLTQIKGVFPLKTKSRLKKDFSKIGKQTNRFRDLDVYLLSETSYISRLPEELKPGLASLFTSLSEERQKEHQKFVNFLNSSGYNRVIKYWEDFLNSPQKIKRAGAPTSNIPVLEVSQRIIYKRYKKIFKLIRGIHHNTSDEKIHELRIECKKLRYLLEFFSSLFPSKKMKFLLSQLKKLQNNLGLYNDYYVQTTMLKSYLESLNLNEKDSLLEAAAIGALISELNQEKGEVQKTFPATFEKFNSLKNSKIFSSLFLNSKS
jgi:CHAD domain-containing protein